MKPERVVFNVEDFFKAIEEVPDNSIIVLDEAGVSYDAKFWYREHQEALVQALSKYKEKRLKWKAGESLSEVDRKIIEEFIGGPIP